MPYDGLLRQLAALTAMLVSDHLLYCFSPPVAEAAEPLASAPAGAFQQVFPASGRLSCDQRYIPVFSHAADEPGGQ